MGQKKDREPLDTRVDAMIERMQEPTAVEAAGRAFDTLARVDIAGRRRIRLLRQRAIDILGTAQLAEEWLVTACSALGGAVPRELASRDEAGASAAEEALGRWNQTTSGETIRL